MDNKTADILKELERIVPQRSLHQLTEARAGNIITSAINLIKFISENFNEDQTDELKKRLLSAIKNEDPGKFNRKIKEYRIASAKNNKAKLNG